MTRAQGVRKRVNEVYVNNEDGEMNTSSVGPALMAGATPVEGGTSRKSFRSLTR